MTGSSKSRGASKKALDVTPRDAPPGPSVSEGVPLPPAEAPAAPPATTSAGGVMAAAAAAAEAPVGGGAFLAAAPPQPETSASAPATTNGNAEQQQPGSESLVDIIRREQANQMSQARTKGTQAQAQKRSGSEGTDIAAAGSGAHGVGGRDGAAASVRVPARSLSTCWPGYTSPALGAAPGRVHAQLAPLTALSPTRTTQRRRPSSTARRMVCSSTKSSCWLPAPSPCRPAASLS
jgi:hypothetical protein